MRRKRVRILQPTQHKRKKEKDQEPVKKIDKMEKDEEDKLFALYDYNTVQ